MIHNGCFDFDPVDETSPRGWTVVTQFYTTASLSDGSAFTPYSGSWAASPRQVGPLGYPGTEWSIYQSINLASEGLKTIADNGFLQVLVSVWYRNVRDSTFPPADDPYHFIVTSNSNTLIDDTQTTAGTDTFAQYSRTAMVPGGGGSTEVTFKLQCNKPTSGDWADCYFDDACLYFRDTSTNTDYYGLTSGCICLPPLSDSPTPSPSRTATSSVTPTSSKSVTLTPTSSITVSSTKSVSLSVTPTHSVTLTPTSSITVSSTKSVSLSVTPTHSVTLTPTSSITVSTTKSITLSATAIPSSTTSVSLSATKSVTLTPTTTVSLSPTKSPSVSVTLTPSTTQSVSLTLSATRSPSVSVSLTPTGSLSLTPTQSATPTSSVTSSVSLTSSVSVTLSFSVTPTATMTRSVSFSPTTSVTKTLTPSSTRTTSTSQSLGISTSATPVKSSSRVSSSSPSKKLSASPSSSSNPIVGLTCQGIPCLDDGNLCTIEACINDECTHQAKLCDDFDICTQDVCSPSTGLCSHSPISACDGQEGDTDCRTLNSCPTCESTTGCAWLQCSRTDSGLGNITTAIINNSTGLSALYLHSRLPRVEKVIEVWYVLGNLSVFLVDHVDFVALGQAQSVFSACLPEGAIDPVIDQYETGTVECGVSTDCQAPVFDQLQAQVTTISTAVGAAGGGGIGCFCGSCVIALLYFRRKKSPTEAANIAITTHLDQNSTFETSAAFQQTEALNPLFE